MTEDVVIAQGEERRFHEAAFTFSGGLDLLTWMIYCAGLIGKRIR
jgi:hypothetical protein